MSFGLTNVPVTLQRLRNHVLRAYLRKLCVACLDNILIYSKSEEEHTKHLGKILMTPRQHHLLAKKTKCEFFLNVILFFSYIINNQGISSDPEKGKYI